MNKSNNKGNVVQIQGGKLVIPELDNVSVRVTPDGRHSVYDVIRLCGKKNPRDAWDALAERYSEVVGKTDKFKFSGRGQRETPVATSENILYIIGLLPGIIGRTYREDAAKTYIRKIEGDITLADEVVDRALEKDDVEAVKWHQARTQGKLVRKRLTSTCAKYGVRGEGFRDVTNAQYLGMYGKDAKELREELGLPPKANLRESFNLKCTLANALAEEVSADEIDTGAYYGNQQCAGVAYHTAKRISSAINIKPGKLLEQSATHRVAS